MICLAGAILTITLVGLFVFIDWNKFDVTIGGPSLPIYIPPTPFIYIPASHPSPADEYDRKCREIIVSRDELMEMKVRYLGVHHFNGA